MELNFLCNLLTFGLKVDVLAPLNDHKDGFELFLKFLDLYNSNVKVFCFKQIWHKKLILQVTYNARGSGVQSLRLNGIRAKQVDRLIWLIHVRFFANIIVVHVWLKWFIIWNNITMIYHFVVNKWCVRNTYL